MSLDGLLHFPWLDADVPLGNGSAAVLEKLLYQGDIVMTVFIDLGGIVLPEAMGTDVPIWLSTPTLPSALTTWYSSP